MILHLYHHCPFCVRAEMVANYRGVPHRKSYLPNDDEETCFRLIGAKMLPILEFDDGTAMGESLDIVERLDRMGTAGAPLAPWAEVEPFLAPLDRVLQSIYCLTFPRIIAIGLPEFAAQSARDYFRGKKEQMIGRSFDQALTETDDHKTVVEAALADIPAIPLPEGALRMGDVLLFPQLRALTVVPDLVLPDTVRTYLATIREMTGTETYEGRAV